MPIELLLEIFTHTSLLGVERCGSAGLTQGVRPVVSVRLEKASGASRDHMQTNAGGASMAETGLLAQVAVGLAGFLGFLGLALTGFRAFAGLMLSGRPALTGVACDDGSGRKCAR